VESAVFWRNQYRRSASAESQPLEGRNQLSIISQPFFGQLSQGIKGNIAVIGKVGPTTAALQTVVGSKPACGKYSKTHRPHFIVTIKVSCNELPG